MSSARRARTSHPHRTPLSCGASVFNTVERLGLSRGLEQGGANLPPADCPCHLPLPSELSDSNQAPGQ